VKPAIVPGSVRSLRASLAERPAVEPPAVVRADAFARARAFADDAIPASTQRTYAFALAGFTAFCDAAGLESLPASPATVAAYIGARGEQLAPRSVAVALAAIGLAHTLAGFEVPTHDPVVQLVRRGHRKARGMAPRRVAAVMLADLVRMLPRGDRPLDVRDRALLLAGWAGCLRRSELIALDRVHVETNERGAVLLIARSKTDGDGLGARVPIPFGRDPGLCAVRALAAWIERLPDDGAAVFRGIDRHGNIGARRVSDRAVALVVKARGEAAGLDPRKLGGHSLRAGFATEAASRGVTEAAIQRHGRWESLVVRDYVRFGSMFLDNPLSRVL
jgi:site-specific recombinase XerD